MSDMLADLQRAFLASMRDADRQDAMPLLARERGIPADTGLAIYRNAYGARLREALDNDHPALGLYLGDDLWARMCDGYIARHPSRVRSLRYFGAALPDYLATTEPFSGSPQIAELARLERCLLDGFDAADAPRAAWSSLTELPGEAWPGLRLRFHPSVMRLRNAWNSVALWQALRNGEAPPEAIEEPSVWLLWRDDERITRFRSLDADEAAAFEAFLSGAAFAEVCERLLAFHAAEAVPAVGVGLLSRWCEEGIVQRWLPDGEADAALRLTSPGDSAADPAIPDR